MSKQENYGINFGALCDSLSKQLSDQGLTSSIKNLKQWQKYADAITLLSVAGLIAIGQAHQARKRLMTRIMKEVKKIKTDKKIQDE